MAIRVLYVLGIALAASELDFCLVLARLGNVQASLALLSLLQNLTFCLVLARLGNAQASLALLSLLQNLRHTILLTMPT